MVDETLVAKFNQAWKESFPGGKVPPPTNQQLLGVLLVIRTHPDGQSIWTQMDDIVKETFAEALV